MKQRVYLLIIFLFALPNCILAQSIDSLTEKKTAYTFSFNGYVKSLNSFNMPILNRPLYYGHLLHNRLNCKMESTHLNASVEIRNRLLWNYNPKAVLYATTERAWLEYKTKQWSIKGGRQRINWGMNNTWNPNDIFNTYNLFDFDYEERAGTDGLRIHYQNSGMSALEFVIAKSAKENKPKAAIKYNFNASKYDWQWIAGYYRDKFTAGMGWQGSIGETGFKGELQYYFKNKNTKGNLNASIELDYITKNGWYFHISGLYNQSGFLEYPKQPTIIKFDNSPENLMPTRWSILAGCSKEITPIINARLNYIYSPVSNLMVLFPSLSFNIITNFDLDLFWQTYWGYYFESLRPLNHTAFVRAKLFF